MPSLLLLGATGLVGRETLRLALADPRIVRIVAPTRRPLDMAHAKLENPTIDYEHLAEDAPWWGCSATACALGTTRRKAGSAAAFRRVDFDHVLAGATLARRHGAKTFALVSAMGANARAPLLYPRTKGEIENAVGRLGFDSLTVLRPNFIGGDRAERRPAERAFLAALDILGPLLPRGLRVNPAPAIARLLVEAAATAPPGRRLIRAGMLTG